MKGFMVFRQSNRSKIYKLFKEEEENNALDLLVTLQKPTKGILYGMEMVDVFVCSCGRLEMKDGSGSICMRCEKIRDDAHGV